MINVAIVDNQQLVREGIRGLLSISEKTQVLWQAANGVEALEKIKHQHVDIVLAEVRMPVMDGISFVTAVRQLNIMTPILMLTTFYDHEIFNLSMKAGSNGFLLKDVSLEKLILSIETLVGGGFMTDSEMLKKWQEGEHKSKTVNTDLTERELQVLQLLVGGLCNKEIVNKLSIAEGTVRNHVSNILAKLDCRDRTQAVLKAIQLGYVWIKNKKAASSSFDAAFS